MSQNKSLETTLQPLSGLRQKSESDNAVVACNDWLRMGTGRTLPLLLEKYTDLYQNEPPTTALATLKAWSSKFGWADRAVEYDANYEQLKNEQRQAVMDYGVALDFERVAKLKRLATFLEAQIYEQGENEDGKMVYHNVWVADVKQIGGGEYAERVDIERFNSALISEYRSTLDDIAKEVGGRRQRHDIGNADGAAFEFIIKTGMDLDDL